MKDNEVDLKLLKIQKQELVEALAENRALKKEHADGILHLLDHIQDGLEDQGVVCLEPGEEESTEEPQPGL